jgi:hypothetical protein
MQDQTLTTSTLCILLDLFFDVLLGNLCRNAVIW